MKELLTGKANIDFEKWYLSLVYIKRKDYIKYTSDTILNKFYREIESMQWGVYQDWFDSVGIELYCAMWKGNYECSLYFTNGERISESTNFTRFKNREKARAFIVKKACEIYNNK